MVVWPPVPIVVVVLLVVEVDRVTGWSDARRGLLRGTTDCASALKASATRLGWLLTRLFQPGVSITSDALLHDNNNNNNNNIGDNNTNRKQMGNSTVLRNKKILYAF